MQGIKQFATRASLACAAALVGLFAFGQSDAHAVVIYGIGANPTSEQRLVTFRSDNVVGGVIPYDTAIAVTGLQPNERLVGIDFRPTNNLLYGVGSTSRLYTINPTSGAATPVVLGQFSTLLNGTEFGVDFNPVADADGDLLTPSLRVVSDLEQSLRINADSGMVTVDPLITRSASTPGTISVAGAAYENNDTNTGTGTRLLVLDAVENNLNQQNPTTSVLTRIGALGVGDPTTLIGFDIFTDGGGVNTGFAAYRDGTTSPESILVTVDLSTGTATGAGVLGDIAGESFFLRGITAVPIPEPTGAALALGAAAAGLLARRRKV